MTSFATSVQSVCLGALALLVLYTLWLSRYKGLEAHIAVRWILIECATILAVILWRWLPFLTFTSGLQDRELLLILTVLFFVFVAVFVLDTLIRISMHSRQIKQLTQELALVRLQAENITGGEQSRQAAPRKKAGKQRDI
ncbi:MAG TPA: DUF2304 family protein [Hyphomicrobiaceae bacterium]|nr:DUF2304 family protein [Hyphomicrobiaceae bacterium]